MKPVSLQGRLLVLALAVTAAVWTLAALWIWRDASHELDELLDGHLAQAAALLVAQQAGEIEHGDHDERDDMPIDAPMLHRYAPRVAFQVWHEGQLVLRSTRVSSQPLAEHAAGFATRTVDGIEWRVFAARGAEHDIQVYVGEQMRSRASILRSVLRGSLGPLLLALPLLGAVLWAAVRWGLEPLRRLGQAVAQRDPQALQPIELAPAGAELPAEVAPLVAALNTLFERIAGLIESERRFTADAAHELRTPIAAIRAQAQVALGAGGDAATQNAALQNTLTGCDRAARLVDQLLTLARLETNGAPAPEPVDLVRVVREVLAELAPQALARGQEISFDGVAQATMHGTPPLLAVLVRNLVDNALRYSPEGARVLVEVHSSGRAATLRVQDSGPGLDEAQLARLGERFFRVLGTNESGSGLGWSIVRRIAQAQGAQIIVRRSEVLAGLDVVVTWPAGLARPPAR
ncbi:MAG: sensor histidine kinase N-terminal domain-containing protein [Burkholderiaceae bacterium]|nr:sensor histidine kinase N-terminal domain-containing protein [Burkholderiaceae bacterium]